MSSDLRALVSLVLDSVDSANTRRVYKSQLESFLDWRDGRKPLSKALIQEYVRYMRNEGGKGASSCNLALAAIRKLAREAADNGHIPEDVASSIAKIDNVKQRGQKTGNWLTIEDARALIQACDINTLKGLRDRVMFGLLLECGLRREEAADLQVDQIQMRQRRPVIADLEGKGGRTRTVPVADVTAKRIKQWLKAANINSGPLLRSVNKADRLDTTFGDGMSAAAIYKHVRQYAEEVLSMDLAPHDLRRTFGKLARKGGAALDQIQASLGHSDPRTTQRYLGEYQSLDAGTAPCDKLNIEGENE